MCGSKKNSGHCCPDAQIFQEEICGNLTGPLGTPGLPGPPVVPAVFLPVWTAPAVNDYFQGTFSIFNSSATVIEARIDTEAGLGVPFTVFPGTTITRSVNNPTELSVVLETGETGKFCINLYKRVFG